jgi:hypothetical protein
MVDSAIIVDQGSTDNSMEIIRELAPEWKIVKSRLPQFCAASTDVEMMEHERTIPDGFKVILNATEFLANPNFKEDLQENIDRNPGIGAFGMKSFCLVDKDKTEEVREPLWKYHTHGLEDRYFGTNVPRHWRFVHNHPDGQYTMGRHSLNIPSVNTPNLFLLWFGFAPWPQTIPRKMQIQDKMTAENKAQGSGIQHLQTTESLEVTYQNWLRASGDLLQHPDFRRLYEQRLLNESSN